MKRVINLLGWIGVFLSFIALLLTLLTTYRVMYIKYFDSYVIFQWLLCITMVFMGINLANTKNSGKKAIDSFLCVIIAIAIIIFRFMEVR